MYNLLAVPALLCGITTAALAQDSYLDSIELAGQAITVEVGKSVTLDQGMSRRVDHVEIDAFGVGGNGMFEVVVDGQVKGTFMFPVRPKIHRYDRGGNTSFCAPPSVG